VANVLALAAQIFSAKKAYTEALERQVAGQDADPAGALEDYLNTLDRLCAYIRWGVISEKRMKVVTHPGAIEELLHSARASSKVRPRQ